MKCFLIEPTNTVRTYLRRYACGSKGRCPSSGGIHDVREPFEDIDVPPSHQEMARPAAPPHDAVLWPRVCACGYTFDDEDARQVFDERLYRRDTGELFTLRAAQPGAMYWADWMEDVPAFCGPDGRSLVVILPDGQPWMIDGIASNCTDREDAGRAGHKCWVRHGEAPVITVDKNGSTCGAGAGSIQTAKWHGFLRNGHLVEC